MLFASEVPIRLLSPNEGLQRMDITNAGNSVDNDIKARLCRTPPSVIDLRTCQSVRKLGSSASQRLIGYLPENFITSGNNRKNAVPANAQAARRARNLT